MQDVKHEIGLQRQAGLPAQQQDSARAGQEISVGDFGVQERELLMELLLSQERVVTLLYERTLKPAGDGAFADNGRGGRRLLFDSLL